MPQVAGLIAGGLVALGVGPATAAFIGTAIVNITVSVGLSYAAQEIAGKDRKSGLGISGKLRSGGIVPRSFIVGRYSTAGSLSYAGSWTISGQAPNAYWTEVIALSDLPVAGLNAIWVNGVKATTSTGTPTAYGYPIPEYKKSGVDYLWVKFYDGTQVAADSFLTSTFGSHPDLPYDSSMIGTGVAYAIVTARLKPDDPSFSGFPEYVFELDGIDQFDPRDSTTDFTLNPSQSIRTILGGVTYGGEWFYGLQNLNPVRLPDASWNAGLNECDLTIDNTDGDPEAQYRHGAEIIVETQPIEVIGELLKACNGRIAEVAGVYKINVGAAGSAVMSFTDDDVIVTQPQTFDQFPSLNNLINGITATYPEPSEGWAPKDAPPRFDSDLEAEDGGRRLISDVQYPAVPYADQVQRLMDSALLEARKFRTHSIVLPPSFWPLEPNDTVSWTSTRNGYIDKLFRVQLVNDLPSLDVQVVLVEADPSDYDFDPDADYLPYDFIPPTLDLPAAHSISSGFAVSGITINGDGGRALAGIRIAWGTGVEDVNGVRYEIRLDAGDVMVLTGETDHFPIGHVDVSENIRSATNYEVRAQYRPISIRETTWTSWLPVTTPDVRITDLDIAINAIVTAALQDNAVTAQKILNGAISVAKFASGIEPVSIVTTLPSPTGYTGPKNVFQTSDGILYRYTGGAFTAAVADGSITIASFASGIEPVSIVTSLPSPTGYTGPKNVFQTSDGKLYRYTGGAFTAAVATVDLTGTIDTAQIADAAITAAKIGANAVTVGKIADDTVTAAKLSTALALGGGNLLRNSSFEESSIFATYYTAWGGAGSHTRAGPFSNVPHGSYIASNHAPIGATFAGLEVNQPCFIQGANYWHVISWWADASGATGWSAAFDFGSFPPDDEVAILNPALLSGTWQRYAYKVRWTSGAVPTTSWKVGASGPALAAATFINFDGLQVELGEFPSAYAPRPDEILPNSITVTEIADNAVTSPKIIAGAVIAGKVAASAITATELAANAVTAGKIAAGTIVAADIAADTITASQIAAGAITSSELASNSVVAGKIAALTIVAGDIAANTITGSKIAAATIAASNMVADTLTAGTIAAGAISSSELAAGAVVAGKIAAGTIAAADIAANTITAGQIAAGAIGATEIAADSILAGNIAASAIGTSELAANAVVAGKIAADEIFAYHVVAGEITTAKINGLAVTNGKLANDSVTLRDSAGVSYGSTPAQIGTEEWVVSITKTTAGDLTMFDAVVFTGGGGVTPNDPPYGIFRFYYDGALQSYAYTVYVGLNPIRFGWSGAPSAASHTWTVTFERFAQGSPYDDTGNDYTFSGAANVVAFQGK